MCARRSPPALEDDKCPPPRERPSEAVALRRCAWHAYIRCTSRQCATAILKPRQPECIAAHPEACREDLRAWSVLASAPRVPGFTDAAGPRELYCQSPVVPSQSVIRSRVRCSLCMQSEDMETSSKRCQSRN